MSTLRANTVSNVAGTGPVVLTGQNAAKAWLDYNQDTPAINESLNISSVSDNSIGNWTWTKTNNMDATTYSAVRSTGDSNGASQRIAGISGGTKTKATDGWGTLGSDSAGNLTDDNSSCLAVHGDLA